MVEIELDGKTVEVPQGSMVMHAANKLGTYVPHFCYHKKLSIAANCRMCLVEVEKAPKPLPACATPVTQGMKVFTHSAKAVEAQRSVMEFLLINHPLDCPICDQGGECQLQDLAVGYGKSNSRYDEEKRVVFHKNVGPLISMQEMSRCIHCTRCVRFGQEVAGVMELGMINRGEHSEITTFVGQTVDSELSGNMIDLCPVGALTSKPFRYEARTWELGRKRSVSPHDSLGANTTVQTKANKVMRVVALDNEEINECWISDRDRFAYEGLNSKDRITTPMVKQGGQWLETDWQSALDYVAHSLKTISSESGPQSIGALAHPISSTEELHLLQKIVRGLGSNQVETRLRQTDIAGAATAPWLGMPIAKLSTLDRALVIGSFLRKDQPVLAARLRTATKRGLQVSRVDAGGDDWLITATGIAAAPSAWLNALSEVALAIAKAKSVSAPVGTFNLPVSAPAQKIADSLLSGSTAAVLIGSAAIAHPHSSDLHVLAQFIAEQTGATLGFLPVGGNAVGASLVNANGAGIESVLSGDRRAVLLMNIEPDSDLPNPEQARAALAMANTVIALSAYKSADLLEVADVILPITPFTETVSTFVNAEGRAQTIQPAVKPLADSRPAWKVLRVLGGLLNLDGFLYNLPEEVLGEALGDNYCTRLNNQSAANSVANGTVAPLNGLERLSDVNIYAGDQIVRRSSALQLTRDAKRGNQVGLGQKLFNALGLKEGDAVQVSQGNHSVALPATLEVNLAEGAVRISAGTVASAKLGSMFGPVTVIKT
ncbi:NADH-quinone oxidoreductase subunit G [Polynucleobacter wuianus]|uniref:NADH-quinone oxidoreductase n=1 Tax=Polynucleobacter wuianus TaxID=1743168 RepID=A0A191UF02_9BURK|nr:MULTISPECIES: NADH-quinone oxidoreductase subunit NuoG [Polynucleobacter]ANI99466.1 NADH-quinone oxidoreductase subunit G [Polynucleobacter wuianus]MBU3551921.1 NADH-quinone oxidoreductase subunit G [Polynucleobacter sp. MWH-Post4-6-1]